MHPQFDVAEAQRLLGVPVDGDLGPKTAAAIAAWKRSRGVTDVRLLFSDLPLQAVAQMERWEGLEEAPPRSNRVPALAGAAGRLGVAPALAAMGYPWCAFCAFLAALAHGGRSAALGLREQRFNAVYTPAILASARDEKFGLRIVPPAFAFRGDLVIFDWDFRHGDPADHLGRLVENPVDGRVHSIDGNSGGDGLVAFRTRSNGSVRAFVRDS